MTNNQGETMKTARFTRLAILLMGAIAAIAVAPVCVSAAELPKDLQSTAKQVRAEAPSRETTSVQGIAASDPDFEENKAIREKKVENKTGRTIYAWDTWYGVVSPDGTMGYYYNNSDGKLQGFDHYVGKKYPKKLFGYNYPEGTLNGIGVMVSPDVCYAMTLSGDLRGICKGDQFCDADGNPKPGVENKRTIFYPKK